MKNLLVLLFLPFLTFSCQEENLSPTFSEEAPQVTPRSGIENAPAQSGFFVTRGESMIGLLFVDYRAELTVILGFDNVAFCEPFPNFDAFQLVTIQQVDIPNDPLRFQIIQQGETFFQVYDGVVTYADATCDFFLNTTPLARGTASIVYTDNDLFANLSQPGNRNAFGLNAKGTLTDPSGNPVAFKANYRGTWDGVDEASFREVATIRLR